LKALADLFISAVEVVEAEGRDLRRWAFRVGVSVSLLIAAAMLVSVAAVLIAVAIAFYLHYLTESWGWALLIAGLVVLACAGVAGWQAHKMIK